jgi:pyruvate/2-oxoglutarate dehydrogenase complex dihydrolipoamide dehydrogenase (E3) component
VLGAGLAGIEAARVAAGLGHTVEIWEATDRPGGQIHLAVMAPDKEEVRPVWSGRWQELEELGVPVKYGVHADPDAIRKFAPDLVIVATGSNPRPFLDVLTGLDPSVIRLQGRSAIGDPALVPEGALVTIIGGGMVGIEVADILLARKCQMTIVEIAPAIAPTMARNNRTDIMLRLKAGGVRILLGTQIKGTSGKEILLHNAAGESRIDAGAAVIEAIGPQPERGVIPVLDAAAVPYVLVGDCLEAGDFMTAIRDGFMVGWSLSTRFGRATNH